MMRTLWEEAAPGDEAFSRCAWGWLAWCWRGGQGLSR